MKKIIVLMLCLFLHTSTTQAQEYVHQVIVLNEGYFDYTLNQSVVPPTIGSYDPITQSYIVVDTLHGARFASDLVVNGDFFYVAADNMLYKYDKNSYNLMASQQVNGIRNLAIWNDKVFVTRGDYDNATFSPILFNSYLQIFNTLDLSFFMEIDTTTGPKWSTQNLVVNNNKLYVGINNAYEWGNEKGLVGIIDLDTYSYLNEIDLGVDGINPDNMVHNGDYIYTINNKDWSGASISQISLLTNSVVTVNLGTSPTGCGTSCLRDGMINYQISGDSILNEWDISLLPSAGTPLSIHQTFYDLSYDHINNLLYASTTDYATTGSINIYDSNNLLLFSFSCGISPGTIAFDVRSLSTGIREDLYHSYKNKGFNYDMLGRVIKQDEYIKGMIYIKNNKKVLIAK